MSIYKYIVCELSVRHRGGHQKIEYIIKNNITYTLENTKKALLYGNQVRSIVLFFSLH